eukprot:8168096-Pyramimonas_sp.AAC.1
MMSCVGWVLEQLAKGKRFNRLWDGSEYEPWDPLTHLRRERGGDLGFRCACIWIKADLAENSHTLGFPSVNSSMNACPF